MKSLFFTFYFLFCTVLSICAEETPFICNKSKSYVGFSIEQFGLGLVEGEFQNYEISMKINQRAITELHATLNVMSLKTGNKTRDRHLQEKSFFDSKRYPYILFKLSQEAPITDTHLKGELKIKDSVLPVELPVSINYMSSEDNTYIKAVSSSFEFDRLTFNVRSHKHLISRLVEAKIDVILEQYDP